MTELSQIKLTAAVLQTKYDLFQAYQFYLLHFERLDIFCKKTSFYMLFHFKQKARYHKNLQFIKKLWVSRYLLFPKLNIFSHKEIQMLLKWSRNKYIVFYGEQSQKVLIWPLNNNFESLTSICTKRDLINHFVCRQANTLGFKRPEPCWAQLMVILAPE